MMLLVHGEAAAALAVQVGYPACPPHEGLMCPLLLLCVVLKPKELVLKLLPSRERALHAPCMHLAVAV